MNKKLNLDILNNSFDYLLSAAEYVNKGTNRDYKYALLHLDAGIELLLKTRLQAEHWSLVFQNTDKASEQLFKNGDFTSVDQKTLLCRLKNIVGIDFKEPEKNFLTEFRKNRNKVQHFSIEININQIKSLIAKAFNLAVNFYSSHLSDKIQEEIDDDLLQSLHRYLSGFQEFVSNRMLEIKNELENADHIRECPRCFQETLIIGNDEPNCPFCTFKIEPELLAEQISKGAIYECPECGKKTLSYSQDYWGDWYCTSCGNNTDYDICPQCENIHNDGNGICENCHNSMYGRG